MDISILLFCGSGRAFYFQGDPERLAYAYLASGVEFHDVITLERATPVVDLHRNAYIWNFDFSAAKGIDVVSL